MYSALYNPYLPNSGNGLGAFVCHDCKKPTRTETGMKLHCWRVHGKKAQRDFSFMPSREFVRSEGESAITDGKQRNSSGGASGGTGESGSNPSGNSSVSEVRED